MLVVDDQELVREVLAECLELGGYEPCIASNGDEGLRQLHEHQPDLVITDMRMPGMDGYEFCYLAREMCGVPIMMVTGVKAESTVLRFNPEIDDYMLKPFEMDEFLRRVAGLISRSIQPSTPVLS